MQRKQQKLFITLTARGERDSLNTSYYRALTPQINTCLSTDREEYALQYFQHTPMSKLTPWSVLRSTFTLFCDIEPNTCVELMFIISYVDLCMIP